jgi:hypothetical protein
VISFSCYSQKDSIRVDKSDRKVTVSPNPFTDSALVSIVGPYQLTSLKISILKKNGQAVWEFIPTQIPFKLPKGMLSPGVYYIRCIDKSGRIPSRKITIKGDAAEDSE